MATFLNQIAKITDHLYLSSFVGASESNVNKLNINCVITVCKEVPKLSLKHVESIKLDVLDRPNESLSKYFDFISDKIKDICDKNGNVLVHCVAGVSRSATIVLAYLMKHSKMPLRDAHDYVKSKRPFIRPNLGFWKQLVDYEMKLFGKNSVKIIPSNVGYIPDIYEKELKNMVWSAPPPKNFGGLSSAFSNLELRANRSSVREAGPMEKEKSSLQKLAFNSQLRANVMGSSNFQSSSKQSSSNMNLEKANTNLENSKAGPVGTAQAQFTTTYRTSYSKHSQL